MAFMARASQWRIYYHRTWGQLSTTCSNTTKLAQWGTPSCSCPQPATDNGVRDCKFNLLAVTPYPTHRSIPWVPRIARWKCGQQIARLAAASEARTRDLRDARPTHCLCGHSGYNSINSSHSHQTSQTLFSYRMLLLRTTPLVQLLLHIDTSWYLSPLRYWSVSSAPNALYLSFIL